MKLNFIKFKALLFKIATLDKNRLLVLKNCKDIIMIIFPVNTLHIINSYFHLNLCIINNIKKEFKRNI